MDLESVAPGSGKDGRITVADVEASAALSEPPGPDSSAAREITVEVRSYLEGYGLWREVFSDLLESYVRNLLRARWARELADADPLVEGSQGQPVANPLVVIARNAEMDARRYGEQLLLTPEALKRHLDGGGDDEDEEGEDPF